MAQIRLMTHNQWHNDNNLPAWQEKGFDCSATARVAGFVRVYKDTMPDIIGCQESSAIMADKMIRHCQKEGLQYALLWGRDTPIAYRPDKFELIDSAFSLFPDDVPGYDGVFNNSKSKSWTLGVFRVKENGAIFIFATTHLWWKRGDDPKAVNYQPYSDEARLYQLNIVMTEVNKFREKYNCPAVIVGDFNANYNSLAVQHALKNGYVHAHDVASDYADETMGYHYCFGDGFKTEYYSAPFTSAIDHIIVTGADKSFVRRFERFSPEYYYPLSDHSPAFIDINI